MTYYKLINNSNSTIFDIAPHSFKSVSDEERTKIFRSPSYSALLESHTIICTIDKEKTTKDNITNTIMSDTTNNDSNVIVEKSKTTKTKRRSTKSTTTITENQE